MAGLDQRTVTVHHGRRHPCHYAERRLPWILVTQEIPLLLDTVIEFPVVQVVQLPGWWSRRADNCGFHSCKSVPVSSFTCPLLVHDQFGVFRAVYTGTRACVDPRH